MRRGEEQNRLLSNPLPRMQLSALATATVATPPWSCSPWDRGLVRGPLPLVGAGGSSLQTPTVTDSPATPDRWRSPGRGCLRAGAITSSSSSSVRSPGGVAGGGCLLGASPHPACHPWPPSWATHGQASSSSPSRSRGTQAGSRKEERTLCRPPQDLRSPGLGLPVGGRGGAAP